MVIFDHSVLAGMFHGLTFDPLSDVDEISKFGSFKSVAGGSIVYTDKIFVLWRRKVTVMD